MMDLSTLDDPIAEERADALPNATALSDYRQYARGRQRDALTPGEQRILANSLRHLLTDNLCRAALQALTNPLKIARLDVAGEGPGADAVRAFVDDVATLNALPTLSRAVHWAMLRDGDHALSLKWHAPTGKVLLQREAWWNGTQGLFVAYNDDDRVRYAVKEWPVADGWRRTLYYPDRIERYRRDARMDAWTPFPLPEDGGVWPVPWVDSRGAPLNPPFVHFANVQVPNDGAGSEDDDAPDSRYGVSELDGGVLGLQDAVNQVLRDVLASAAFAGFPMLALMGFPPMLDATGAETPLTVEPGAVLRSSDAGARAERIEPGSMAELERALGMLLKAFSRATTVPLGKLVGADWPSGTALILSMLDYFEKLEAIADATAPMWASVMHKATRLANTFARAGLDESLPITVEYAPVIRYDALTQAKVATAIAPFVSEAEVLRTLGYTQAQIDSILAERADDQARNPDVQRTLAEVQRTQAIVAAEQRAAQPGTMTPDTAALMDRITQAAGGIEGGA